MAQYARTSKNFIYCNKKILKAIINRSWKPRITWKNLEFGNLD